MPNLTAVRYSRAVGTLASNSFTTARESDSNSFNDSSTSSNLQSIQFFRDSGKGNSNYRFYRFFAVFDFSSYVGYTITNLKFNYRSTTSTAVSGLGTGLGATIFEFNGMGSGPSFSQYSNSEFFDDIDFTENYSPDSGTVEQWTDANSSATLDLNSTATAAASSTGELKIAIVQYPNDATDTDQGDDVYYRYYLNFNTPSSGFVPFMSFDAVAPGYGNEIVDVSSANIGEVVDVATGNISTVVGV